MLRLRRLRRLHQNPVNNDRKTYSTPKFETVSAIFSARGTRRFRHRDIKAIQGHRNKTIKTNEVTKLGRAMYTEGIDRCPVSQFWQHAAACQPRGHIIGDALLAGEIGRPLPRDNGGDLRI